MRTIVCCSSPSRSADKNTVDRKRKKALPPALYVQLAVNAFEKDAQSNERLRRQTAAATAEVVHELIWKLVSDLFGKAAAETCRMNSKTKASRVLQSGWV